MKPHCVKMQFSVDKNNIYVYVIIYYVYLRCYRDLILHSCRGWWICMAGHTLIPTTWTTDKQQCMYELQNGCCFTSTVQTSQVILQQSTISRGIHGREVGFTLVKSSHYKSTISFCPKEAYCRRENPSKFKLSKTQILK